MSRESFVFLLGFIVFFTSFLGIPREWKEWIFIGTGILLMFFGYKLRRAAFLRSITNAEGEHRSDVFVEQVHREPVEQIVTPEPEHHHGVKLRV